MNDIMKIVQALEDSGIVVKDITKTIENGAKEQEGGFLGVLLGALGTNLLGNMLAGIGIVRAGYGNQVQGTVYLVMVLRDLRSSVFNVAPSFD